jgi:hypothetical protein
MTNGGIQNMTQMQKLNLGANKNITNKGIICIFRFCLVCIFIYYNNKYQ